MLVATCSGVCGVGACGVGGGAVAGASGKKHSKRKDDEETLIRENINLSLVDDVIGLIMKRGIMQ